MSSKKPQRGPAESTVEQLSDRVDGAVLRPGDAGYDEARSVWNGMVDREPMAVVTCRHAGDVVAAVTVTRDAGIPLAVKSGGHGVAGRSICDSGIVVDLSSMNEVRVDPVAKTARVGPGATWGEFDAAAQEHGLATTGGVVSTTGVGGLTLGGGIGYLARTHGLSVDNLRAVELVTAAGEVVAASERENADLFWGVRGGGGNFGVVTAFEFDLHEVGPSVLTAQAFYPFDDAVSVLKFYREFTADAPDELSCYLFAVHVPPVDPFPEAVHGDVALALIAAYVGDAGTGEAALAPLSEFGDPILRAIQPMPYTALQQSFDAGAPEGGRYYWKSHFLHEISDEAIATVVEYATSLPGAFTMVGFEPMGGAIARVDPSATAYRHREAAYNFGIFTGWTDPRDDAELVDWTRAFDRAMAPHATRGVYANYLDSDDASQVHDAFGENYDRLAELKAEWDPENLFHLNQNVEPAT